MLSTMLLLLLVLTNVAVLAVLLATLARARAAITQLEDQVREFFAPAADGGPSAFADVVDKVAAILSARIITSAEAAMRGSAGGAAKAAAAQERAAAIEANPLLGLLGGKLGKSPLATMALSMLGSKIMGGSAGAAGGELVPTSNGSRPKFHL